MRELDASDVPFRNSLQAKVLVGLLLALILMLAAMLVVLYTRGYELLMARERALAQSATQRLASEIAEQLAFAEGLAVSLANVGEVLPPDESLWRTVIPRQLNAEHRDDLIAGGGLWPEPGEFAAGVERRSFFWGRGSDGGLRYYDDYNKPDGPGYHREEWYAPVRHQRNGRCYWSRSYRDPYTDEPMVTCSVPMRRDTQFVGISTVDLRLSGLQEFLDLRRDDLGGYAFVLDRNGVFITLPPIRAVAALPTSVESETEQLTMRLDDFAAQHRGFAPMAEFLRVPSLIDDPRSAELVRDLSSRGNGIDAEEAARIAAQLRDGDRGIGSAVLRQSDLARDPFLAEAGLVTTLRFPGVHWQLVVVQPARLVHDAVTSIMTRVALALSIAIAIVIGFAGLLIRRSLVSPLRRMSDQIAANRGRSVPLAIDVVSNDEFGLLARQFNAYAEQIARSNAETRAMAAQFRSVAELAHDALIQIDDEGRICSLNRAGEQMFGWRIDELERRAFSELLPWDPRGEVSSRNEVDSGGISRAASRVMELSARRRDGSEFPAEVSVSYWRGPKGGIYNIQVRDVTERRRAEAAVHQLATLDTLTGLPNRVLFNDRLQQGVEQTLRERGALALLFLDLDHFKLANDSLGHTVGDALLRAVSERLRASVRPGDTVARLGGDEFAIVLPNLIDPGEAAVVAERIIETVGHPFEINGQSIRIGVSIGVTLCPSDDHDVDQLMRKADMAMFHAKAEGRNTFRFFTEQLHVELVERKALLDELGEALAREELILHYQPVFDLREGTLTGIEALLRWQHPTLGLVSPDRFIPLAEQSGLIVPIGHWVLRQSLSDLAYWDRRGLPACQMAVNLSLAQFRDPALCDTLAREIARSGLSAPRIELELTETVLMHNQASAVQLLTQLRAMGVQLAIDDFGTGYSSLAYLRRFPVQKLKIDKSFVLGVADDGEMAAICRAVIGLAHALGLKLTGEGVELTEDLEFLRQHGCDSAQGFLFSPPLPIDALATTLPILLESARRL